MIAPVVSKEYEVTAVANYCGSRLDNFSSKMIGIVSSQKFLLQELQLRVLYLVLSNGKLSTFSKVINLWISSMTLSCALKCKVNKPHCDRINFCPQIQEGKKLYMKILTPRILKTKMVELCVFDENYSLRSNSFTRRSMIDGKCQNWKIIDL